MKSTINRLVMALILIFLNIGILASAVKLHENVIIDAEFRPRFEIENRDFSGGEGLDSYATYRTRLGVALTGLVENTDLYLMIGDSRTMGYANPYLTGDPAGPNNFDNNLGVIKAYFKVNGIFGKGSLLKIGRMSNDQGRALLFGPGNWNYFGPRTYDGIKTGIKRDQISLNIWHFYGANGDRHWYPEEDDPSQTPNPEINYKHDHTLTGIDISVGENKVNLLTYLDLDQAGIADTVHGGSHPAFTRATSAVNLHFAREKTSVFWLDADFAYQFGSMAYGGGSARISSYLAAADVGWCFESSTQAWIGIGFHILSGDDGKNPGRVTWFYDKYCSKHRVLGHMDYFKSDTGIKSLGIRDFIFRAGVSPTGKLSVQTDIHHFSVEKPYISEEDAKSTYNLGWEVDTTVKYNIYNGLQSKLGIDFFLAEDDWQGSDARLSVMIYGELTAKL